jgi:hypothetical protein
MVGTAALPHILMRYYTTPSVKQARESVLHFHTPPSWLTFIERAYSLAEQLPPIDPAAHFAASDIEIFSHREPDRSMYEVFGFNSESTVRSLLVFSACSANRKLSRTMLKIMP